MMKGYESETEFPSRISAMDPAAAFTFDDALKQLAECRLGHARRTARLLDSAQRICRHPAGSLPEKLHDPNAYRATLELVNHPSVTHPALLQPHHDATLARMRQTTQTVLVIHDTTELDYSKQQTLASMGPIGNGGGWGYECHNSLAVDAESGELLGLVGQLLHQRARKPKGEGVAASRERANRESLLWLRGVDQVGPAPAGGHWVDVCDRGADTFEFVEHELRQRHHFVIRSSHNRALDVENPQLHLLHDQLRALPGQLGWEVEVSANNQQTKRRAKVQCDWCPVQLQSPQVRRGKHGRDPLHLWAIRVWEVNPPAEAGPALEWLLLTDEPIPNATVARQRVGYYEKRPRVEEYHKALKTGMSVESLQLQSQAGIQPVIALLSILAVALVNARETARCEVKAVLPATVYFDPVAVEVLSIWRYQEARPLTVREYIMAMGRLGGHLNRKRDGLPGWITIWRGAMKLHAMVEYELSRRS
jgi:hypothetical protein